MPRQLALLNHMVIDQDGELYHTHWPQGKTPHKMIRMQWVVPCSSREHLMVLHHDTPMGGHLGHDKLYSQLMLDYWWPTIYKDVDNWVKSCWTCQEHANPTGPTAATQQLIASSQPLEKMGMDLIGPLPKSSAGNTYALVMQDYFTKWPKAIPLWDATAKMVAGALLMVISTWGPPKELLSDQGPEFVAEVNCKLSRQQGIKWKYVMVYHPQMNGLVERFNRMLKSMIAKFVNGRQDNWDTYLPAFLYAY